MRSFKFHIYHVIYSDESIFSYLDQEQDESTLCQKPVFEWVKNAFIIQRVIILKPDIAN